MIVFETLIFMFMAACFLMLLALLIYLTNIVIMFIGILFRLEDITNCAKTAKLLMENYITNTK
nr:MAG TPA: hypothetical protein [Caudoviricetes sp.]